jgi:hypothetical protein
VSGEIAKHFRFRWIQSSAVNLVARKSYEELITALAQATAEETYWSHNIRPTSFASPLMLPEQFLVRNELEGTWRLSRSYNNMGHLRAAVSQIDRFNNEHRKKVDGANTTPWVDRARWVWEDNGARHGAAIFPQNWKYAFRIPDGHHFDVTPPKGARSFRDSKGTSHALSNKGYWNITAHGFLRG